MIEPIEASRLAQFGFRIYAGYTNHILAPIPSPSFQIIFLLRACVIWIVLDIKMAEALSLVANMFAVLDAGSKVSETKAQVVQRSSGSAATSHQ